MEPNSKQHVRLYQDLSQLCNHKFRHCFQETLNLLCAFGNYTETITHFFLHCPRFCNSRKHLLKNIRNINKQTLSHNKGQLIQTFLYGNINCSLTVKRLRPWKIYFLLCIKFRKSRCGMQFILVKIYDVLVNLLKLKTKICPYLTPVLLIFVEKL